MPWVERHRRSLGFAVAPLWAWLALSVGARAESLPADRPGTAEGRTYRNLLAREIEQAAARLKNAEDNQLLVETQYTKRPEVPLEQALSERFLEGELRYLLGDYRAAAVVFYDLRGEPAFKSHPQVESALFYLADSLLQTQNDIGAKRYLKEVLAQKGVRYREALQRYLDVAVRTNDFSGIDQYVEYAKDGQGKLPSDLAYAYGKAAQRNAQQPLVERLAKARAALLPLAQSEGRFHSRAAYLLGIALVQEGKLKEAADAFTKLVKEPAQELVDRQVKEQAYLSLGRLHYEMGQFDQAIECYQELSFDSEHYADALFELAWARVKKGDFVQAQNATDLLLLVAPDSPLAPEARILHGSLLSKLEHYSEAQQAYQSVIHTYAPVRDEIDALLSVNADPVAYFDDLLAKNNRQLDVVDLLPPVARNWATIQADVTSALAMVNQLEAGKRELEEARAIAARIFAALADRGLKTFPELMEGYTRADAVDSALTEIEQTLIRTERDVLFERLPLQELAKLSELAKEEEALRPRFASLPTSEQEVSARKTRMQQEIDRMDKQSFWMSQEVQGLFALSAAVKKYAKDTRSERHSTPEEEAAFLSAVQQESEQLTGLEKQLHALRQELSEERATADAALEGEEVIRSRYLRNLEQQRALMEPHRQKAEPSAQPLLSRIQEIRTRSTALRSRARESKRVLLEQVKVRGEQIRQKVDSELALVEGYHTDIAALSPDAKQLVGKIAFDGFRRALRQFKDLVLKADVGLVDAAFTRKQKSTQRIQALATQKDHDLRALDEEFKDVLRDE